MRAAGRGRATATGRAAAAKAKPAEGDGGAGEFGGGELLRTQHIRTLEMLVRLEKEVAVLRAENEELRRAGGGRGGGGGGGGGEGAAAGAAEAKRVKELEARVVEAEARAATNYCRTKEYEESWNSTVQLVRDQRRKLARFSELAKREQLRSETEPAADAPAGRAANELAERMGDLQREAARTREERDAQTRRADLLEGRLAAAREAAAKAEEEAARERHLAAEREERLAAEAEKARGEADEQARLGTAARVGLVAARGRADELAAELERTAAERDAATAAAKAAQEGATGLRREVDRLVAQRVEVQRAVAERERQASEGMATTVMLREQLAEAHAENNELAARLNAAAAAAASPAGQAQAGGSHADLAVGGVGRGPRARRRRRDTAPGGTLPRLLGGATAAEQHRDRRLRFPEFVQLRRENDRLEATVLRLRQELMRSQRAREGHWDVKYNSILPFSEKTVSATHTPAGAAQGVRPGA